MSMPIIKGSTTTRCQAITDIVESVALEQTALSHILNAEGEKIQAALAVSGVTPTQLLAINTSVQSMVDAIARLEMLLQGKLAIFADQYSAVCP